MCRYFKCVIVQIVLFSGKKETNNEKHITNVLSYSFVQRLLTLKAPITTAADDTFKYTFFYIFFYYKRSLDISCELSAKQRINMKFQGLRIFFFLLECHLLQILLGALRVKSQDDNDLVF